MIRKCIICGKGFKCSPSDKIVTCSKECSRIHKSHVHTGRVNLWSQESKDRLSAAGQTANLKLGMEAAMRSPKSGRFVTNINAIDWHLVSPEGKHYYFHSLAFWLRQNCQELFGCTPDSREYKNVSSGLRGAKRAMLGGSYGCCTYKGWSVIPNDEDYKRHGGKINE